MFAKVENGVTKSCKSFRRKNRKNTILACFFHFFEQDRFSLVVRESRDRRDRISDKNSQNNSRFSCLCLRFFQQSKVGAHALIKNALFLARKS